jgi:hypothetical protein
MRTSKTTYFDCEGRSNLPAVLKNIKSFLRALAPQDELRPTKIVFLTLRGEGPILAYNQLQNENLKLIAVTFPRDMGSVRPDGSIYYPEIPEKARKFFDGVGIPIVTNRLPFDNITGADNHNREMRLICDVLGIFGGSVSLAIQAVLQAVDAGEVNIGEHVIAVTGDTALLVTATSSRLFLQSDNLGLSVNEVICKPRIFTQSRAAVVPKPNKVLAFGAKAAIESGISSDES